MIFTILLWIVSCEGMCEPLLKSNVLTLFVPRDHDIISEHHVGVLCELTLEPFLKSDVMIYLVAIRGICCPCDVLKPALCHKH